MYIVLFVLWSQHQRLLQHWAQAADQIAVLDAGSVVELGTHEELVAQGGRYKQLINSQSLSLSR